MTNIYNTFKTNTNEEKNGKWIDYEGQRTKIRLSGNRNTEYIKALSEVLESKDQVTLSNLSEEQEQLLWYEIYAKSVIVDNEIIVDGEYKQGVLLPEGDELVVKEFNWQNMKQLFEELPHFFESIKSIADDWMNFKSEVETKRIKK